MFIYKNVRKWIIKELAESGHPIDFLDIMKEVISDIDEEELTDDDIRREAWVEEEPK